MVDEGGLDGGGGGVVGGDDGDGGGKRSSAIVELGDFWKDLELGQERREKSNESYKCGRESWWWRPSWRRCCLVAGSGTAS